MGAPAQHEEQSLEFLSFKMLLLLLEWLHLKIASVESTFMFAVIVVVPHAKEPASGKRR
ncbi:unnamed protein product [Prunus brigantina]